MSDEDRGPFGDHRATVAEVESVIEGARQSAFPAGEEGLRLERASDRAVRAIPRYMLSKLGGSPSGWTPLHHEVFAQAAQMEHDRRLNERLIAAMAKLDASANRLARVGVWVGLCALVVAIAQLALSLI